MEPEFRRVRDFPRGTLFTLLEDAYSFDSRWREHCAEDWRLFDDFFFDAPSVADKCGFITALGGEAIGFTSWDPRRSPEIVQIGHNCIACAHNGKGYGKRQLAEAVSRIRRSAAPGRIVVETNSSLIARHNYESVGFTLCARSRNETVTSFAGDRLEYELIL